VAHPRRRAFLCSGKDTGGLEVSREPDPKHPMAVENTAGAPAAVLRWARTRCGARTRRSLAPVLLLGLFLSSPAAARPNIVLILSDDQNWRDYSFSGENPYVRTPNIDALAAEGVIYRRAYVPHAHCRASLASIFTGLNPVASGVTGGPRPRGGGQDSFENDIVRRNVEYNATLPRILRSYGYRSLQTGKWWEGAYERAGFDEGETTNKSGHLGTSTGSSIGRNGLRPIEDFVRRAADDGVPFFVSYAPLLPHTPHVPPARFRDPYDILVGGGEITGNEADYFAMIEWFDSTVGDLRAFLRDTKGADGRPLEDDTLYVYAVDNGWLPLLTGSQRVLGAPGAKRSPFEDGVRGPLIFSWKGRITDARSVEQKLGDTRLASTIDILPTLLALVGAEVDRPELAQGIDLMSESRSEVFGDTYETGIPIYTDGRLSFDQREVPRTSRWMIEGRWKLIVPDGDAFTGEVQLYDVLSDPAETTNLAASTPKRVTAMADRLDEWWDASRPNVIYDHEFRGDATPIDGVAPDIDNGAPPAFWHATGGILGDGTVAGGSTALLPFVPQPNRRYELRASVQPLARTSDWVAVGFLDGSPPAGGPKGAAVGWTLIRDAESPQDGDLVLHAREDGSAGSHPLMRLEHAGPEPVVLSLVLDTGDKDPRRRGDQWSLELLLRGVSQFTHVYTRRNPDIRNVGIGSSGSLPALSFVDYVQLVETPRFESLAWLRGDTNGDGDVDRFDLAEIFRNLTGPQTAPPTFTKVLREGDLDGDGDVDSADVVQAFRAYTGPRNGRHRKARRFGRCFRPGFLDDPSGGPSGGRGKQRDPRPGPCVTAQWAGSTPIPPAR